MRVCAPAACLQPPGHWAPEVRPPSCWGWARAARLQGRPAGPRAPPGLMLGLCPRRGAEGEGPWARQARGVPAAPHREARATSSRPRAPGRWLRGSRCPVPRGCRVRLVCPCQLPSELPEATRRLRGEDVLSRQPPRGRGQTRKGLGFWAGLRVAGVLSSPSAGGDAGAQRDLEAGERRPARWAVPDSAWL